MPRFLLTAIVVAFAAVPSNATTLFSNGSFEDNTAVGTQYDLSNAAYNALVANSTAFGSGNQVDLINGFDFGPAPVDGSWKILISSSPGGGTYDAVSLALTAPLTVGDSYVFDFYGAYFASAAAIDIGLSTSATNFGTLIFSGTPTSGTTWTHFSTVFVAPVAGSYITMQVTDTSGAGAHLDAFDLEPTPEPFSALLCASGLALLGLRRFRRR